MPNRLVIFSVVKLFSVLHSEPLASGSGWPSRISLSQIKKKKKKEEFSNSTLKVPPSLTSVLPFFADILWWELAVSLVRRKSVSSAQLEGQQTSTESEAVRATHPAEQREPGEHLPWVSSCFGQSPPLSPFCSQLRLRPRQSQPARRYPAAVFADTESVSWLTNDKQMVCSGTCMQGQVSQVPKAYPG